MTAVDWTKLNGDWYNELGSKMSLTADDTGSLSGTYHSNVGGVPQDYPLSGRFDPSQLWVTVRVGISLGWTVTYIYDDLKDKDDDEDDVHKHSTATWSGLFFDDNGANPARIITQWLLTSSTEEADIWESTSVGNDTFTNIAPQPR